MGNKEIIQALADMQEVLNALLQGMDKTTKEQEKRSLVLKEISDSLSSTQLQLEATANRQASTLSHFPKSMEVKIQHRFEGNKRAYLVILFSALLLTSVSIGMWYTTWQQNKQFRAHDYKYRYVSLIRPTLSLQIDSLYNKNGKQFSLMVGKLEAEKAAIEKAEAIARGKEEEARKASEDLDKLKRSKQK